MKGCYLLFPLMLTIFGQAVADCDDDSECGYGQRCVLSRNLYETVGVCINDGSEMSFPPVDQSTMMPDKGVSSILQGQELYKKMRETMALKQQLETQQAVQQAQLEHLRLENEYLQRQLDNQQKQESDEDSSN